MSGSQPWLQLETPGELGPHTYISSFLVPEILTSLVWGGSQACLFFFFFLRFPHDYMYNQGWESLLYLQLARSKKPLTRDYDLASLCFGQLRDHQRPQHAFDMQYEISTKPQTSEPAWGEVWLCPILTVPFGEWSGIHVLICHMEIRAHVL